MLSGLAERRRRLAKALRGTSRSGRNVCILGVAVAAFGLVLLAVRGVRGGRPRNVWRGGVIRGGLWDEVKDDVAIAVKTGHEVAGVRLADLKGFGWWSVGRDVPNVLVVGDVDVPEWNVVGVKGYAADLLNGSRPEHWFDKAGWRGDKDKNLPALHMLRSKFPGKKWYLLLDDDTYIFLDNFARYIKAPGMDDKPVYTGKVFFISNCGGFAHDGSHRTDKTQPKGTFAHGGSGIVINHKAMELVFPSLPSCIRQFSSCWAGDMQVGLCMRGVGVFLHNYVNGKSYERNFIPFWPSRALADKRYTKRWKGNGEPLTFHKLPHKETQLLSEFESICVGEGVPVVYNKLRHYIQGHGIQPHFDKPSKWNTDEFKDD